MKAHMNVNNLSANIEAAKRGLKFVLPDEVAGWCPIELGSLLNNLLAQTPNARYLELGTFCGRSLIYALRNNPHVSAYVIDPLPDTMRVGQSTVWKEWNKNIDAYGIRDQITLYRHRTEDIAAPIKDIDIAFIDGNHDSGHTLEALIKCEQYLSNDCLIIVDDYNIYGGAGQTPFPGYELEMKAPVKKDVHEYLAKSHNKTTVLGFTPWLHGQIYIHFQRK